MAAHQGRMMAASRSSGARVLPRGPTWAGSAARRAMPDVRWIRPVAPVLMVVERPMVRAAAPFGRLSALDLDDPRRRLARRRQLRRCARMSLYPLLTLAALFAGRAVGRLDTRQPTLREIAPTSQPVGQWRQAVPAPDFPSLLPQ